ncbi:major capsid protein [Azospirillum rugosum]|uniref:Phage protein n=1 Tax=Azospirillum rugosum TaxID=416170 RepID=A0ABS4SF78_9PROT|nr:hypothetical protein [Azospirillum rugosum]MBP2290723.1 hypothetical protein [Azospirillum rugosum]MDQ0525612.1 hypothetical protein [Azospirillum rugosum]
MSLETLRTIALEYSKKQPKQIDHLTEETPILDLVPFSASTHDMWHVAEELTNADAMGFVAMDAPLPAVNSNTKLIRFDLAKMGGQMTVAEDKARQYGGKEKYFADRSGPVLKNTGMNTERVIVYDNLRQYAIDQFRSGATTKTVYDAGGTGSTNYSIIAVRFEEGVCSGLYNPKGFGNGTMFDTTPINGGNLYDIGGGVLGYGVRMKSDLGFQLTGVRNVGTILNIDFAANKVPTDSQIDDLLADVRATGSGRTMLLMHQRVKNWMGRAFKKERIQMRPEDKNITRQVDAWDGVPLLTSYNLYDGTEGRVVLS